MKLKNQVPVYQLEKAKTAGKKFKIFLTEKAIFMAFFFDIKKGLIFEALNVCRRKKFRN